MARYLTPAKIGLLVLLELYTEEAVPSDATMPILSFITSHVMDYNVPQSDSSKNDRWTKGERFVSLIISIKDFEKLLGTYPLLMGLPGRRLWDQFLTKLWAIDSLDTLNVFFEQLSTKVAKTKEELRKLAEMGTPDPEGGIKLWRNSPFGIFVRRCRIEYLRLRFHDCADLWKDFVKYRQPTAPYQKRKNPRSGHLSFDSVLLLGEQEDWDSKAVSALAAVAYGDMLTGDHSSTLPVSTDDVELLVEFQIEQMQSG